MKPAGSPSKPSTPVFIAPPALPSVFLCPDLLLHTPLPPTCWILNVCLKLFLPLPCNFSIYTWLMEIKGKVWNEGKKKQRGKSPLNPWQVTKATSGRWRLKFGIKQQVSEKMPQAEEGVRTLCWASVWTNSLQLIQSNYKLNKRGGNLRCFVSHRFFSAFFKTKTSLHVSRLVSKTRFFFPLFFFPFALFCT